MPKGRVSLAVTAVGAAVAFGLVPYLVEGRSGRAVAVGQADGASAEVARKEIEAFNVKFLEAHQRMDNAAIVGMWAEDGVSLLPETAAIADPWPCGLNERPSGPRSAMPSCGRMFQDFR